MNSPIEMVSGALHTPWHRSGLTMRERMTALALAFPELERRARAAVEPFDAKLLKRWTRSGAPGHGGMCAALFVLSVWNPYENKKFDLHEALGVWDNEHRRAFVAWCMDPWWP
jgi:hypothetical protein